MSEFIVTYQLYNEHGKPIGRGHNANVNTETIEETRELYTAILEQRKQNKDIIDYKITRIITYEEHLKELRQ